VDTVPVTRVVPLVSFCLVAATSRTLQVAWLMSLLPSLRNRSHLERISMPQHVNASRGWAAVCEQSGQERSEFLGRAVYVDALTFLASGRRGR
jgi:hypothetical protein